ncbi:GNAT family N-acetyltransferase [Actinacidiphila alni]|uniref:GNAT family N-acetyltransferase n=1 Tax=Actinacidiphila alni TaxID=380248 RepID=UPI003453CA23
MTTTTDMTAAGTGTGLATGPDTYAADPSTDLSAAAPEGTGFRWSARPVTAADHAAVLDLFTEPDFYFRTHRPDTRPQWEVLSLLDEDTRLLSADGRPVGLYALEVSGGEHACHFFLHLRLTARLRPDAWASAYRELIRALRWQREVVRLAVVVGEFDDRGLTAARLAGFTEEGVLAGNIVHDGHRRGSVFLSRIWEPTS